MSPSFTLLSTLLACILLSLTTNTTAIPVTVAPASHPTLLARAGSLSSAADLGDHLSETLSNSIRSHTEYETASRGSVNRGGSEAESETASRRSTNRGGSIRSESSRRSRGSYPNGAVVPWAPAYPREGGAAYSVASPSNEAHSRRHDPFHPPDWPANPPLLDYGRFPPAEARSRSSAASRRSSTSSSRLHSVAERGGAYPPQVNPHAQTMMHNVNVFIGTNTNQPLVKMRVPDARNGGNGEWMEGARSRGSRRGGRNSEYESDAASTTSSVDLPESEGERGVPETGPEPDALPLPRFAGTSQTSVVHSMDNLSLSSDGRRRRG